MMVNKRALKINEKFYYGWVVLAAAALAAFFSSPGQTFSISAFIDKYIVEFNYSRTEISAIYSTATVISGVLMIFMGRAVDKFGARRMLLIVGVGLALITFFNGSIMNLSMIFISFFFLRFFGQGSLTLIPGALIPQWFEKKRAFALSIVTMGTVFGNFSVPVFNTVLISNLGWRYAWYVWGGLILVVFLPIIAMTIINKPEDIGLLPDNEVTKNQEDAKSAYSKMMSESFTLKEALKTLAFWAIGLISMIVPLISTGMFFHFFSMMETKGIGANQAAFIIGLVAIPGLFSPVLSKWIVDRYKPRIVLIFTLSAVALDLLFMMVVGSFVGAVLFILIYGFATGIQNISINVMWPNYFGRGHLGSIRGAATVFTVVGSAFGTVPFGLSYDLTGGYTTIFVIMSILSFCGILLVSRVHKPVKE